MSINSGLHVGGEFCVRNRRVPEMLLIGLRNRNTLAELATGASQCFNDGNRTVILLDDHLQALPTDSRQEGMDIAGELGFSQAQRHLVLDNTESSCRCLAAVLTAPFEGGQPSGRTFQFRVFP